MEKFNFILKELRKSQKLTQLKLAKDLNTTDASINRYEKGLVEPNLSMLKKIANYFNVSIDYLLGNERQQEKVAPEFEPEQLQIVELIKKLNSKQLEKVYNYLLGMIDAAN